MIQRAIEAVQENDFDAQQPAMRNGWGLEIETDPTGEPVYIVWAPDCSTSANLTAEQLCTRVGVRAAVLKQCRWWVTTAELNALFGDPDDDNDGVMPDLVMDAAANAGGQA